MDTTLERRRSHDPRDRAEISGSEVPDETGARDGEGRQGLSAGRYGRKPPNWAGRVWRCRNNTAAAPCR